MQKTALKASRRDAMRQSALFDKYRGNGETIAQAKLTIEALDALDVAEGAMWAVTALMLKAESVLHYLDNGLSISTYDRNSLRNTIADLQKEMDDNLP